MEIITHFQAFLNRAILFDQTHLINTILHADKQMEYFNSIHNKEEYRVKLSDGEIIGTAEIIAEKQEEVELELTVINRETAEIQDSKKYFQHRITVLEKDLKLLEDAKSSNRHIFQWLLVPHWLGDELINFGEVVFREFGCNFWGVTNIVGNYQSRESTLLEVFEELHNY